VTRLDDFAANDDFTVDGEAGMISHVFERIGPGGKVAVEFGAGDGQSCSNTARLWRQQDWSAVLIEPDPKTFAELEGNALPFDTTCVQGFVRPTGPWSIAVRLDDLGVGPVDLMSIDVDGDDYFILRELRCRPRVIVAEFNPTIPPHVEAHQRELGETFGASLLALVRVAAPLGYRFVGASRCNAFFVLEPEAAAFAEYETNPQVLFPADRFCYAVTDFHGRVVLCGEPLPWQAKEPYVLPVEASTYVSPVTNSPQHLRRGFESVWGPAWWPSPAGLTPEALAELLVRPRPPLVCIDVTSAVVETRAWMVEVAADHGYRSLVAGSVLGLVDEKR
jgi:hypothetical protein